VGKKFVTWKYSRRLVSGIRFKKVYPGCVYTTPQTIWEALAEEGIHVDTSFAYPFRATYDYESYFSTTDLPSTKTGNTLYTARHVPLSVAIA
jgi:hypothetical protein